MQDLQTKAKEIVRRETARFNYKGSDDLKTRRDRPHITRSRK